MAKKDKDETPKPVKKTTDERVDALEKVVRALQDQLGVVKTV